jgi:sterol desaturase/sphingolipid hydroxylase (fatty acid hydroxylase superfamily)
LLITILLVFACCFVLERLFPGWPLPRVRTWPLRVLLINGVQLCVVLVAGLTWERWLSSVSIFHLSAQVPPAVGGLIAYGIATFVFYWWHRWRHEHPSMRRRKSNCSTCWPIGTSMPTLECVIEYGAAVFAFFSQARAAIL